MANRYYCEKCDQNHLINSDIGKRHRGIKVKKPPRKTYEVIFPDGTRYKTTSIYNYKYAVIRFAGGCSHLDKVNGKYISWHTDYQWFVDLYVSKEKAENRYKWFAKRLKVPEDKGRCEIEKVKIITLDQKKFKKY